MEWYDEGRVEYDTSFEYLITWDYMHNYRIVVKLIDVYTQNEEMFKRCGIRVLKYQAIDDEDGQWVDITNYLFRHEDMSELKLEIRPTLDNLREVMRIIEENENEEWESPEGIE